MKNNEMNKYNLENIIKKDYLEDYIKWDNKKLDNWWIQKKKEYSDYKLSGIDTIQDAIKVFGFKKILNEFLKDHNTFEILSMLNFTDIEKFVREQKLKNIEKSQNGK